MKQGIEDILERYYQGETTLEEEKQLRRFFQNDDIPEHLMSHSAQFRYFSQEQSQLPSSGFSEKLAVALNRDKKTKVRTLSGWMIRIAAGFALLMIGFAGGTLYNNKKAGLQNEIAGTEPVLVLHMRKVLAFEQIPQTSASERIEAVNQSYDLARVDQDITGLLANVLNFDVNVNVRLAALQALLRFENEPGVRQTLIQSLSIQTDPNLQIRLIEALVAMKEKRAVEPMQQLARNQDVMEVVRLKATEGINLLDQQQKT